MTGDVVAATDHADLNEVRCPIECDDDCEVDCHAFHYVLWKRGHDPAHCPAVLAAEVRVLRDREARVRDVASEIAAGEHATTGRQFGQGMAHAEKLIRTALDGDEVQL